MLYTRTLLHSEKLTWIRAYRICPWLTPQYDQLVSGGRMQSSPQPRTWRAEVTLAMALTFLALFFFVLTSANVSIQSMDEHSTEQSTLTAASLDCPASSLGSSHAHCQNTAFGNAVVTNLSVRFLPILGSSVWRYAAVTCGSNPINQLLLRPPKLVRAHV